MGAIGSWRLVEVLYLCFLFLFLIPPLVLGRGREYEYEVKYKYGPSNVLEDLPSPTGISDQSIFAPQNPTKAPSSESTPTAPVLLTMATTCESSITIAIPKSLTAENREVSVSARARKKVKTGRVKPIVQYAPCNSAWSAWSYWQTTRVNNSPTQRHELHGNQSRANRKQYGSFESSTPALYASQRSIY
jgi:hypothetical protein